VFARRQRRGKHLEVRFLVERRRFVLCADDELLRSAVCEAGLELADALHHLSDRGCASTATFDVISNEPQPIIGARVVM